MKIIFDKPNFFETMNTSAEPELEERRIEKDNPLPKMRPKIIDFQRNYDQSLMSTYDGNTASNVRSAMKFSPSIESVEKMNESDIQVDKQDGVLES